MLDTLRRPDRADAPSPWLAIGCAVAMVAIVGVGLSLTITLIALRLGEEGFSARAIGFNTAAAGFATLASAGFVPGLARRVGVRGALIGALALCVLCLAAMAVFEGYWSWLLLRAAFGVGLTVLFVLSEYWINAVAPPERRGAALGFYAASVALGFAAGPLILSLLGAQGAAPFVAAIALFAAATPIALRSGSAPPIGAHAGAPMLAFLAAVPVATLAGLLHGAIETASMGLLPVFALRSGLGVETGAWFVALFALGAGVFQFPIGFLADRMDRGRIIFLVAALSLAGALALAALPGSGVAFAALLFAWGGVAGSLYAVALGYLGARYRGVELANANAAFVTLYSAGMLAGPPVMGFGMDAMGPGGFFIAIAASIALYLVVAAFFERRERQSPLRPE